uniref:ERCC4 domain-containing protein n=1 Tax=Heligmosomoides polygyrus TaxID=6339 RepID=A0A183FNS5_HELPZ
LEEEAAHGSRTSGLAPVKLRRTLLSHQLLFYYAKGGDSRSTIHFRRSDLRLRSFPSESFREAVYLEGGVQFLTSRILLVDLLTDRVPVKNIAGILIYRAHQILSSFQESFILRLYRERKPGGFVKAFTDLPTSISALGQLQRVIDRLYIKSVRLLPRFDADIKATLEKSPAGFELVVDLPPVLRRVHTTFVELLKVCIRELKQCSTAEKQATPEEDTIQIAVYRPTLLERQLNQRRSFLTDKQSRLMADLTMLRELLQAAENMDPATVLARINAIRSDKEVLFIQSGTWMMSRVATTLIHVIAQFGSAPPKWRVLASVLDEIKSIPIQSTEVGPDGPSVMVFVDDDAVARQVADLIKNGPEFLSWMAQRVLSGAARKEPARSTLWDIENAVEPRKEMISHLQKDTIVTARASKRRRKVASLVHLQERPMNFPQRLSTGPIWTCTASDEDHRTLLRFCYGPLGGPKTAKRVPLQGWLIRKSDTGMALSCSELNLQKVKAQIKVRL